MAIRVSQPTHGLMVKDVVKRDRKLAAQQTARLVGVRQGDAIVSTCGILWVTQEGDASDYMLRTGERFVVSHRGRVVVQALTDAAFRVG